MSKYQITHSCGCTVTHNIVGTNVNGERERKAAWLADRMCSECYRKHQQEQAKADNADLPALTGSDKQIVWAETIRATAHKGLTDALGYVDANKDKDPVMADKAISVINETLAKSDSRFWIDNRAVVFDVRWVAKQVSK